MFLCTFTRTAPFDKGLKMSVKTKHNNIVILLLINRTPHPITIRYEYCQLNLILSFLWNATLQQVYKCLKHSRRLTPSSNIKAKPDKSYWKQELLFKRELFNYQTRRLNLQAIIVTWSVSTMKYKDRKDR